MAELAGEPEVRAAAERIAGEERGMIERLEGGFDRSVEASLRALGADDLTEQLPKYLADAHAIEQQAITLLERGPKLAGSERLHVLGPLDAQGLGDAARRAQLGRLLPGPPGHAGKLACFARAFEHLEIGGYEQLRRVAERASDEQAARVATEILTQEREAADRLGRAFDEAVAASLESQGLSVPGARGR